jgi:DNA-binding LacI/PurR family transcriptional regulator
VREILTRLKGDHRIIGYIVNAWWPATQESRERYHDLFDALTATKKPVAVLDEAGNFEFPSRLQYNRFLSVFRIAAKTAGRAVGRRLLSLGHRRAAFFSYRHGQLWSQKRFLGVSEEFSKAGLGENVAVLARDEIIDIRELVLAASGYSERTFERVFARDLTKDQYEHFLGRFRAVRELNLVGGSAETARARADMAVVAAAAEAGASREVLSEMSHIVMTRVGQHLMRLYMQPLFEKALADSRITAWIGANDTTGLAALRYLRARGVSLPDRLSLVSFENLPEAFGARLTSYDFGLSQIIHHMLRFITEPPGATPPRRLVPLEVEGLIIERGSLGRAAATS